MHHSDELSCDFLLKRIAKGKLALMNALPDWTGVAKEENLAWKAKIISSSFDGPEGILALALGSFSAKYANIPEPRAAINSEICLDLVSMQHTFEIMTDYRRFIAIAAPGEPQPPNAHGVSLLINSGDSLAHPFSQVEWITVENFNFGDGFEAI